MNDTEREMWIRNDQSLYSWWQSSRLAINRFMRENRNEIDACICKALER